MKEKMINGIILGVQIRSLKKKIVMFLLSCMFIISIAGCGKMEEKKASVKTNPAKLLENKTNNMSEVEKEVYQKFKDQQKNDKNFKIVEPTDEEIKKIGDTEIGIAIPSLAYVDEKLAIMNDARYIYAYSFEDRRIRWMCDIRKIGFSALEGDEAYVLNVNTDGTKMYLSYASLPDQDCYAVIDVKKGTVERTVGEQYTDLYQPKIDEEQKSSYSDVYIDGSGNRIWMQIDQKGNKNRNVQIVVSSEGRQEIYTPFVS